MHLIRLLLSHRRRIGCAHAPQYLHGVACATHYCVRRAALIVAAAAMRCLRDGERGDKSNTVGVASWSARGGCVIASPMACSVVLRRLSCMAAPSCRCWCRAAACYKGAVAALDKANISHGVNGDVVIMGFDCNKWALEELLAGNWNYDGQCNPFQASYIDDIIKKLEKGETLAEKTNIMDEKGFDATTITQEDVDKYGI